MPFRRSAYGLIVESHEGRPTKIEGNPSHPSTLGASSSLVQASMLGLYDPDRSQAVRLKGEPKSWSDFVTAWQQLSKAHAADGGVGLAVLSESFSSPTLARLASEFRARYPRAIWATYEAVSDENRLAGLRSATGRDLDLMLRLDRASVILALDADPLLTDPEMIRHARGFADGRRAGVSSGEMNRLYVVEGVYSLHRSDGGSSPPSREPQDRAISCGPRCTPCSVRCRSSQAEPASQISTRSGSTPSPRTFWRTAARG